mmetsp:Transcript_40449/g.104694  ORF Transcript_40449/g.104694 Transcript_40449/m.104694 type:complete len:226 (+) Transcript_40449:205-882(+)
MPVPPPCGHSSTWKPPVRTPLCACGGGRVVWPKNFGSRVVLAAAFSSAAAPMVFMAGSLCVSLVAFAGPPMRLAPGGRFVMFAALDPRDRLAAPPHSIELSTEWTGMALAADVVGIAIDTWVCEGSLQRRLRRGLNLLCMRSWLRCCSAVRRTCSMEDVRSRDSRSFGPTRAGWMLSKMRGWLRPWPRSSMSVDQRFLVLEPKCASPPARRPAACATSCAASGRS